MTLILAQWELLHGLLGFTGVALVTIALLMMLRKRKQQQAQQPTAREQLERLKQKQAMRGDLEHLMVELEQLTRRFNAQLDAKSLQLEKLIDQADRRIDELKRLQGQGPRGHYDRNQETACTEPRVAARTSDAETPLASPPPSPLTDKETIAHRVYELADQGHDASAIAQHLDEHVGKIELMIALRKA